MNKMESKKRILVCGCGAIGSNLCTNLIDIKDQIELSILDLDSVEGRNFRAGTQFYHPTQLGMPKVQALRFNLYKWFGIKADTYNIKLTKNNIDSLFKNHDLIIDTFDNHDSRKLVHDYCLENKIPCLHCGFSPFMTFEISWSTGGYTPPADYSNNSFDLCVAPGARSFIMMVAALGSTVIQEFIQSGEMKNLVGNRFSVSSF